MAPRHLLLALTLVAPLQSVCAQEKASLGWTVGVNYAVRVTYVREETARVTYPKELELDPYDTLDRIERTYSYVDRIDAVQPGGRVTKLTRHFVEATQKATKGYPQDHPKRTFDLQDCRFVLSWVDADNTYAWSTLGGEQPSEEQLQLLTQSLIPEDNKEWNPPRNKREDLVNVIVGGGWPPRQYVQWPNVVNRQIDPGFSQKIRQGNWIKKMTGDHKPLGKANLKLLIFGALDLEEDGVPVTHTKRRQVEVEMNVTEGPEELPVSFEEVILEIRQLIADKQLDQARERLRAAQHLATSSGVPEHLMSRLNALEKELY